MKKQVNSVRKSLKNTLIFYKITRYQLLVSPISQLTFAEAEYAIKKRTTRREQFLAQQEERVPWQKFNQQLSKGYRKVRPRLAAVSLSSMLK